MIDEGQNARPDPVVEQLSESVRIVYVFMHDSECPTQYSDDSPCCQSVYCKWEPILEISDGFDAVGNRRWRTAIKKHDLLPLKYALGAKYRPPYPSSLSQEEAQSLVRKWDARSQEIYA